MFNIHLVNQNVTIPAQEGVLLSQACADAGFPLDLVCGGQGKCGKCKVDRDADEKIVCVIAVGYGENQGVRHKSKPLGRLCDVAEPDMPGWFRNGVKAAMMAPTAMNQQRFHISLQGKTVVITADAGPMTMIDLGIVKCNFEVASGYKFNE